MPYKDPEAQAQAQRAHYENNKQQWRDRGKALRARNRQFVQAQKNKPCMDCGVQYPHYVMDFDHRPDEVKVLNLSNIGNQWSNLDRIQAEIDKCDLVCANCHRIRTYERQFNMG